MTDCSALCDRMPEVAHGQSAWSAAETGHLASCADCALEWRIVRAGATLHAAGAIDVDALASAVLKRLRDAPAVAAVPIRRLPWRSALVGLASVAAAAVLIVMVPRLAPDASKVVADSVPVADAGIPELNNLTAPELESVLQSLQSSTDDGSTETLPRLGNLDEAQLEQLLASVGG